MRKSKTGNQRNGQKKKDKRTTIYEPQALELVSVKGWLTNTDGQNSNYYSETTKSSLNITFLETID
jgi:hypothetical protein